MSTFIERCLSGHTSLNTIDDFVEEWHYNKDPRKLYEAIGITYEEYNSWVQLKVTMEELVNKRRS